MNYLLIIVGNLVGRSREMADFTCIINCITVLVLMHNFLFGIIIWGLREYCNS